jgi:hypothetical protein
VAKAKGGNIDEIIQIVLFLIICLTKLSYF